MAALSTTPDALSTAQLDAVAYLAAGNSISAAAQHAGVHRATIHNWLKLPDFRDTLLQAREDYAEQLQAKLKEIANLALDTIRQTLTDPAVPSAVKLKAALAVLDRPLFPKPAVAVPVEPAQQPATATPVGVPRNAACPCGSGNKFKRCCGSNAPPQLSRAA